MSKDNNLEIKPSNNTTKQRLIDNYSSTDWNGEKYSYTKFNL